MPKIKMLKTGKVAEVSTVTASDMVRGGHATYATTQAKKTESKDDKK